MQAYRDGDIEAFDALHARFAGRLRTYFVLKCRDSTLAEDLLQNTFMQIHKSRDHYRSGLAVSPWIYGIARNVYLMNRRSTTRRMRFEQALEADVRRADQRDGLRSIIAADEVRRALRRLPPDQRQAVVM